MYPIGRGVSYREGVLYRGVCPTEGCVLPLSPDQQLGYQDEALP